MPSDLVVATAGAVAAAASTAIMYPIDTVKTRLSLGTDAANQPYKDVYDVVQRTWKFGGLAAFYRGLKKKVWMSILQKFLYFYFFNFLKRKLKRSSISSTSHLLLLGYCSAVISSIFVTPLEVVQTRLQLADSSCTLSLTSLLEKEGLAGLYRGFGTNLVLCFNPAIEYTVFDKLKNLNTRKTSASSFHTTFVQGVVAKTAATLATYPYIRAKTMQQATGDIRPLGHIVFDMLANNSAYKGIDAQLSKVVLSSALMLVIKEQVEDQIITAFK